MGVSTVTEPIDWANEPFVNHRHPPLGGIVGFLKEKAPKRNGSAPVPPGKMSPDQLEELLSCIDVTRYRGQGWGPDGTWWPLVCAAHHGTGGSLDAKDKFVTWAWTDPEYELSSKPGEEWDRVRDDKPGGVTWKTLLKHARESSAGDVNKLATIDRIEMQMVFVPQGVPSIDSTAATAADGPMPIDAVDLQSQNPDLHEPVIEGLLRVGETANLIAAPKTGKSWLAYSLALSVATGRKWLDHWETIPGRVLLIDNELHKATIAGRIPMVADAMGLKPDDYRGRFDVYSVRGRLESYAQLAAGLMSRIESGYYSLIIVDAHYRQLGGVNENDNGAITAVYNLLDHMAMQAGAAWVLIHHTSKGAQGEKAVTDVGAGAGSQSRAADAHLVLRPHVEEGHIVLDTAVRSWKPPEPVTLRWNLPLWVPSELDPSQLETATTRKAKQQDEKDEFPTRQLLGLIGGQGQVSKNWLKDATGWGDDRLRRMLRKLVEVGSIVEVETTYKGRDQTLYELP